MTRFRTIADKIKERIEAQVTELAGKVVVFRRNDIESEFEQRMAKTAGKCVIVRLLRARRASPGNKLSLRVGLYTVTLFTLPVFTAKDTKNADDLMSEIETALQGWWPEGVSSNTTWFLDCGDIDYPETFKMKDGTTDCAAAVMTVLAPGNLK